MSFRVCPTRTALLKEYRPLLREYRSLSRKYRSLLRENRARLREYRRVGVYPANNPPGRFPADFLEFNGETFPRRILLSNSIRERRKIRTFEFVPPTDCDDHNCCVPLSFIGLFSKRDLYF